VQGNRVRLLRASLGVPAGSEGVVVGCSQPKPLTYVVRFGEKEREVLAEDLAPVVPELQGRERLVKSL